MCLCRDKTKHDWACEIAHHWPDHPDNPQMPNSAFHTILGKRILLKSAPEALTQEEKKQRKACYDGICHLPRSFYTLGTIWSPRFTWDMSNNVIY